MHEEVAEKSVIAIDGQIAFEEESHTYTVNGKRLPSVTQIMKKLSEKHYENISEHRMRNASDRGKRVHLSIELYEQMGIDPTDDVKDYVTQYKVAKRLEKFKVLKNEVMMTNGEFCGTVDIIGEIDGDLVLIDLKATSKIYIDMLEIQLAGYEELATHNGFQVKACYGLQLKPNGYKWVRIKPNRMLWQTLKYEYIESIESM